MSNARRDVRAPSVTRYGSANLGVPGGTVSYREASPELLRDCVAAVAAAGDCIMFSATSDGGACSVRVLSGGLVEKWYPSRLDDLEDALRGILEAAKAAVSS